MWKEYVIDADMSDVDGNICICPVERDEQGNITSVVTGYNILTSRDGLKDYNIVAVISMTGDDAVADDFYNKLTGN